jgi:hypothetical protein
MGGSPPAYFAQRQLERRSLIATIKLDQGCADCGYDADPVALQFDHLPGFEKRRKVGAMMQHSIEAILDEIDKCEVVCSNCHAVRTWRRANAS